MRDGGGRPPDRCVSREEICKKSLGFLETIVIMILAMVAMGAEFSGKTPASAMLKHSMRGACVLISFALVFHWCARCAEGAMWQGPTPTYLACAGLVYSLFLLGAGLVRSDRMNQISDGLLCLAVIVGGWLIAAAASSGNSMCPLCLAFWVAQGLLLLDLLWNRRRMTKFATAAVAGVAVVLLVVASSQPLRAELASALPNPSPGHVGPHRGDAFPEIPGAPKTGVVVLATECAPCMLAGLERGVRRLAATKTPLTVLVGEGNAAVATLLKHYRVVRVPDTLFEKVGTPKMGPPIFVELKDGRVAKVGPPASF